MRFDIAMDETLVMKLANGQTDLKEDTKTSFLGEGPDTNGISVELLDLIPDTAVTVEGREKEILLRTVSRVIIK